MCTYKYKYIVTVVFTILVYISSVIYIAFVFYRPKGSYLFLVVTLKYVIFNTLDWNREARVHHKKEVHSGA